MRPPLFQQTIAEYTCSEHCGYHRSVASANLVLFHLAVAAAAALPLWIRLLGSPWYFPWYYLISILAGELLLVILSGFVSSVVLMPFMAAGTTICRNCGSAVVFCGRHFDPKGAKKPHWSDVVVFVVFIASNVEVWITLSKP